ncbi:acyl-CoA thioesterase [Nocardioides yefusunii]|uniref:Acyl-CoA thioesterase n=1 Tax=Nocardioides yefusunii TaxID=2500546 RepID=A0ABW1QXX4_9ACTN|nr:acyl-CoA thioesterase domain-containing protein [Nocardioides yefusunii]
MAGSAAQLLELLDLEVLDVDLYRGRQPDTQRQRVFGGQVAAQAQMAARLSTDARYHLHSLHSHFLRPGDPHVPIVYVVERLREGRAFANVRVVARQRGRDIYHQMCTFQVPEEGLDHHDVMPDVPPPSAGLSLADLAAANGEAAAREWQHEWAALDIRHIGMTGRGLPEDPERKARARMWVRIDGDLPEDPVMHEVALTYASDLTLLGVSLVPHGLLINDPALQPASLDHTIWFHRPLRANQWWLYDQTSPSASGGRGLALARIWSESGELAATVAQEGLIRRR